MLEYAISSLNDLKSKITIKVIRKFKNVSKECYFE